MRLPFYLAVPMLALGSLAQAQDTSAGSDVLFILDGSGSMWGRVNDVEKIVVAKDVMTGLIEGLPEDIDAGLISYGHRARGSCSDIEVIATPGQTSRADLLTSLSSVTPLGKTPISGSLLQAGELLRQTEDAVSIVLVSDGLESCEGDPCATAAMLREQDIDVRIHVVGFDVDAEAREQLSCIAEAGGGEYYQASSADALNDALADVRVSIVEQPVVEPIAEAPEPVAAVPNIEIADDVLGTVDVISAETNEKVASLFGEGEAEVAPGSYVFQFRNFTSPALSIEAGTDYVIAAADYGLATVRLDETTISGIQIFFDEDGERVSGMEGTSPQQFPPGSYRLKFRNFEVSGYVIEPSGQYVISASDFGVAEIALAETVLAHQVDVFDDATGERVTGMTGTQFQQIPSGTYRFEFPNFTSPPMVLEAGESYTIAASDFGVAEIALAETVLGSQVAVFDDETGKRVMGMTGTRFQQIPSGTYRFKFPNFTSPPVVLEAGENYTIAASDFGVAEIALADTVLGSQVAIFDDKTGERVMGVTGTRFQQILSGTYRFKFPNFTSPPVVIETGASYTITASDFGVAEIALADTVLGSQVAVFDDETGKRVMGMTGTRFQQVLAGTYRFEFADFISPPVTLAEGSQRIISPADFGLATVNLDRSASSNFWLRQDGQDPINLKNGRPHQIGPGPYMMVFDNVELGIIDIAPNETRVIKVE